MFLQLLKGEFLKQKRSFIWAVVFGMPLGSFLLTFLDFMIRKDYLTSSYYLKKISRGMGNFNVWDCLFFENNLTLAWFLAVPLVVTFVCSILTYTEYKEDTWKVILSRPVSRKDVYLAKGVFAVILTFIVILFQGILVFFIGKIFGFKEAFQMSFLVKYIVFEMFGALAIVSVQYFISMLFSNTMVSTSIGFCFSIGAIMFLQSDLLSKIIPYSYMLNTLPFAECNNYIPVVGGIVFTIIAGGLGVYYFSNKDIN